ncbi:MAG: MFS transporter [Chloroflexota bacterium]|nr:MFS transporter [Chloroflexota bacterium]
MLRWPAFRWLFVGSTLSSSAQWIQSVTLSWLIYEVTGSGAMLGAVNLVQSIAILGLSGVAGVAIDRLSRRRLMLLSNGWLLVVSLALGLVLLAGRTEVWYLFVFAFLSGMAQSIDLPLRQTIVFVLVPRALVSSAIALIQTGWALMRSFGPAIGGFLILWVGPGGNFVLQAAVYGLILLTVTQLTFPAQKPDVARGTALRDLREGLRYVATERRTRAFLLMGWVLPLFIIPNFSALPPIYAKDIFGGGPEVLGTMLSAVGVGGIVGGIVTAALGSVDRRGLLQLVALLLLSLTLIGFALSPNLQVALPLLGLAGFFEIIYLTTNQTLLQLSVPDALRGRVSSIINLNVGLMPIGALVAGVGADLAGPRVVTLGLSAIGAVIAVAVFFTSPTVRDYRLSQATYPNL